MRQTLTLILVFLGLQHLHAQRFIGLQVANGSVADQAQTNFPMAANAAGEIYCAVPFYEPITIGGFTLNPVQNGLKDIALIKLSPTSEVIWAKVFGSNNGEDPLRLAVDGLGQVYVSWTCGNGVAYYFDETGTTTDFPNIGAPFYGLTCFSPDGTTLWHKPGVFGTPVLAAIADEPGVFAVDRGAIRRLDADGDVMWQLVPQPVNALVPLSAAVAGDKLAIGAYGGNTSNTITVDTVTTSVEWINGGVVYLLDTAGHALWGRPLGSFNGNYAENIRHIAIDLGGDAVYCGLDAYTGSLSFAGTTLVNPAGVGNGITPVLKYDLDGNEVWGRFAASVGFALELNAMALAPDGGVCFGGRMAQFPVEFGSISIGLTNGSPKAYQAKLSADGDAQWFKYEPTHGGPGVNSIMRCMLPLSDGSLLTANYFWSSFSPPVKTGCLQAPNTNNLGMYFSRVDPNDTEPQPDAQFTHSMSGNLFFGRAPQQEFPTTFTWTFGDGGNATGEGVAHVFPDVGSFEVCLTASNTCGTAQHCVFVDHPGLRAITPTKGGQGAIVSALALGGGFVPGTTWKLTRTGEADILPSDISVGNTATVFGRLDLQGAALGLWNVEATVPGVGIFTLPNAFEVEPLKQARIKVNITGPMQGRTFLWGQYNIRVSNTGNEDAVLVPLHIRVPDGVEVEWFQQVIDRHSVPNMESLNTELDQIGGDYDQLRFSSPGYGITRMEMVIPVVGANSYNDYIVRLRSFTPMHITLTATAMKPLIGSRALADETVMPLASPYTNYMEVAAEWVYDRTFPRDQIFGSVQRVIRNYATGAGGSIGGVSGWPTGMPNPPPGQIGGIGNVNLGPIGNTGGSGSGYATPPFIITPPREWQQSGPQPPVPPPPPPPPVGPPPPPPAAPPPAPTCGFNGCCAGSCGGSGGDWPYGDGGGQQPETPPENAPVELPPPSQTPPPPPPPAPPPAEPGSGENEPEDRQPVIIPPDPPADPEDPNPDAGCYTGCSCDDGGGSASMESCAECTPPPDGTCDEDDDGGDSQSIDPTLGGSFDPNAIQGPRRNGDIYLNNYLDHAYTISFENLASATLPAQRVVVIDTLDLARFDAHSFRFLTATVGDSATVYLEPRVWDGNYLIDMTPQSGLYVGIHPTYDPATGILRVEYMSIDPQTMAFPTDPLAGFLPPNTVAYEGTGSLSFMVNYRGDIGHGDAVSTRATIFFDDNEPIVTNTWTNILDRVKPTGSVQLEVLNPGSDTLRLVITGTDDMSGLAYQHVFISVNGHKFRRLITTTQDTIGYIGFPGENLRFFSRAVDKAGNVEDYPVEFWNNPDAETDITTGLPTRAMEASLRVQPNPARDAFTCTLVLPEAAEVRIELLDAMGGLVMRPNGSQPVRLAKGEHRYTIPVRHLASGVYMLKAALPYGIHATKVMVE